MRFILTGFTQDAGDRVFAFEGIGTDQVRAEFTVRADMAMARRFNIPVQELPLLCRGFLERREDGAQVRSFIFAEEEMRLYMDGCNAIRLAAAERKKNAPPRKPAGEPVVEHAWPVIQP